MVNIQIDISDHENNIVEKFKHIFRLDDKKLVIRKIIREFNELYSINKEVEKTFKKTAKAVIDLTKSEEVKDGN